MRLVACKVCGTEIEYAGRGRLPRYCSMSCRNKIAYRKRAAVGSYVCTCTLCGTQFTHHLPNKHYCSPKCTSKARQATDRVRNAEKNKCKTCKWCGQQYTGYAKYFCSNDCQVAWQRDKNKHKRRFTCQQCGESFKAKMHDRDKFCSRKCAFEFKRGDNSTAAKYLTETFPHVDYAVKQLKPKKKQELIKQFWKCKKYRRCGICDNPLDIRVPFPNTDSVVLDHIYPRSLGGTNDLSNLQLAHKRCNERKNANYPYIINNWQTGAVDMFYGVSSNGS
jgi:hypothetical protein